jgi:amino acid transporter
MEKKDTSVLSVPEDASSGAGEIVPFPQTKRGLTSRHVQLMAIAGSIGTGLFVGIGSYLRDAGPLSVLLGFLVWGCFMILPVNLSVGEMAAYLPIRGSIFELAARFIDPAFGFAM